MPSRARSKREQRDALTRRLRAEGQSWAQVAPRIQAAEHVSRRAAMRLAHGWTQWEVARRWNERWPAEDGGAGISDQVISYWETWPQSGREPSVKTLWRLALLYECGVADLIDEENYSGPGDARHAGDEPLPAGAGVAGIAQLREDDTDRRVAGAPREITGTVVDGRWVKVPVPAPAGFAYRWSTEPDLGGSATEREVVMAAHEGSEHAESAEQRDIGDATLEQIRADVIRLSRDYMTGEPFALFREMRSVRSRMYAALDRRLWPRDQTELYFLLGCLSDLMAVAAYDLGSSQASEELIRAGWAYAVAIDHRPLMGQLRLQLASIASWHRPRQSRDHAARGLQYLPDGPNAAQLHLLYGRAAARLGDAEAARRAITAATEARDREHQDEMLELGGEFVFSRATLHYYAGSIVVEIPGAAADAVTELERATELYAAGPEPGEDHSRHCEMFARTDLATARLRAGSLDAAVVALAPVLSLPPGQRISGLPPRFGRVRTELASARYQGSAGAVALDEQIEVFLSETVADDNPAAS
ncbi:MAG TPA: helix-turn-helix transcriptional regulator [Streptosporangiaceae bacterium]|nr:helix-turn-helix transcriptional regulator [Streptosporangiaceae bacterium]